MICKHCYVIPKSLTKTLSNLRELERKLRFLLYSGLLLFKGNGGRGRVKGGRGQEQGGRDGDAGNGNGGTGRGGTGTRGAKTRGAKTRGAKTRGKGAAEERGQGEQRRKERERERQREKQEEGKRGNWNGIQGSSRQKRIKF